MRSAFTLSLVLLLLGCEHDRTETVTVEKVTQARPAPPPPPPAPAPPPTEPTLDDLILDVQNAADGPTQATALNRLHVWLADRKLTYTVRVQRADTDQVIAQGASVAAFPTRATIFVADRGQPFRDFGFNCKDNRNLVIFGVR